MIRDVADIGGSKEIAPVNDYPSSSYRGRGVDLENRSELLCFNFARSVESKEDIAVGVPGIIPFSFNEIIAQMDF